MGAPKLTDKDIEKAVLLLDGWAGKLTWDRYLAVLAVEIGHTYTKVAMLRQPRIKAAWDLAKEARVEIRKVVWPSREETTQTTLIVVAVVIFVALILWGLDSGLSWLIKGIIG